MKKKAKPNRYKKGKLKGARLTKWRRKHKALASAAACAKKVGKTGGRRKKAKRAKRNPTVTAVTNRRRRVRAKRKGKLRGAKLAAWKRAHPALVKQSRKRRTAKRSKARRNPVTTSAVMNRRRRRARRNAPTVAVTNRRRRRHARRYPLARRNVGLVQNFKQNRHRRRRHAVRNPAMDILKLGAKATLGFVLHGVGTYIVGDVVLARFDMFKSGTLGNFRDAIAGVIVAAVGVPVANKVDRTNVASAGMIASAGRKLLLAVLKQFGQDRYAGYLGEYYPSGIQGIGAYEYDPAYQGGTLMQAQAGFGAPPRFMQAAAAFGTLPQFMQAAAGMGQFTQAAAGMGEYIASPGMRGIGEYIPVNGVGAGPSMEYDGIRPDTDSAIRAISVAEAAAGVGDIPTDPAYPEDLPQTSPPPYPFDLSQGDIWDATQVPAPPGDISQAMRDGILAGGQGIFG